MRKIADLEELLENLSPTLLAGVYVYCSIGGAEYGDFAELRPLVAVREDEGLTLVVEKYRADRAGLRYEGCFRCITLSVYSDLQAVGLTAAVATRLTENRISANIVAGTHHDHVLVPQDRAEEALALLESITEGARGATG